MSAVEPPTGTELTAGDGTASDGANGQQPVGSSPRPTYAGPTAIPYAAAVRYLWGDDEAGRVSDWIYASTDLIHMLVYALPAGGACLHSEAHRTVFGADVTYFVLQGTLALANPRTGEVRVAEPGEAILFRRDTWHHIFAQSTEQLRVLEFFAPPPSTGTSRKYAQQLPYLDAWRYTDDALLGRWPPPEQPVSLHLRGARDRLWRREGDALLGVLFSTEHLTVATLSLLPGQKSDVRTRGGDECLYVVEGVLRVHTPDSDGSGYVELGPGDGFYCPRGTAHQYYNIESAPVQAVVGVAPTWTP
jgi:quercetin dioxygenase-like cupin family protein